MNTRKTRRVVKAIPVAPPPARTETKLKFTCPCGTALRVPPSRINSHGRCPMCMRRLLLTGSRDKQGRLHLRAIALGENLASGQTFVIDQPAVPKNFRIEDHFREITEVPSKIPFKCPCGRKLVARPNVVDKRGKCPWCQTRLLLVGKANPRTGRLEIHPLVLDAHRSGDTMVMEM